MSGGALLIRGGTLFGDGERFEGYVVVRGDRIAEIGRGAYPHDRFDGETIDAREQWVLPGAIDDQVRGLPTRPISAASRPPPPPVESLLLWICRTSSRRP